MREILSLLFLLGVGSMFSTLVHQLELCVKNTPNNNEITLN